MAESGRRIVVVGGSAGAIGPLKDIASRLPADFAAPVCVVIHISPESPGVLPELLSAAGGLPAHHAQDGDVIRPGHIYVAPPDRHLLTMPDGRLRLGTGPKENRFRPAVDPLFRSAALVYGSGVIGVVLSGGLDDGAAGLAAIKAAGGAALVQRPEEASAPSMPMAALRTVSVDRCLPASEISESLLALVAQAWPLHNLDHELARGFAMETDLALGVDPHELPRDELGDPSVLTCPDCGGVLRRLKHAPLRFRCQTGHAYSAETLIDAVRKRSEDALWATLQRVNEEQDALQETSRSFAERGQSDVAERLAKAAEQAGDRARMLRALLK